jgi:ABC-type phosphate transport system permease subunit
MEILRFISSKKHKKNELLKKKNHFFLLVRQRDFFAVVIFVFLFVVLINSHLENINFIKKKMFIKKEKSGILKKIFGKMYFVS